ncbi:MAG: tetratricopeptide repeat protein [Bacteroidia bacterium]
MENQKYKEMLNQSGYCPSSDLLWDYAHGKANVSSTQELEKHLAHCVLCTGAVEGFAAMDSPASLKQLALKNPYASPSYSLKFVKVMVALLCVISILWWWNSKESANTLEGDSNIDDSTALPYVNVESDLKLVEEEKKVSEIVETLESNELENIELESISANRWKDELFTIEKKGIVLAGRNQVKLEIVDRPLTPIIYMYNLKVMDFTEKYGPLDLPFEVPSNLHPRFANPNEKGMEQIFADEDTVYYRDLLESAMDNFDKGRFKLVAEQLSFILNRYPNDDNGLFYSSLAMSELRDYEGAIKNLRKLKMKKYSAFVEEVNFHLAMNLIYSGNRNEGEDLLRSIANSKGFYSAQSQEKLEK